MGDFYIEKKVYSHDSDGSGTVYYANYLKYLEEGICEYCYARGADLKKLVEAGTYFVVVRAEIDYWLPARYYDNLRVYVQAQGVGDTSISFSQRITKGDAAVLDSKIIWVCLDRNSKSKSLPEEIRKSLL